MAKKIKIPFAQIQKITMTTLCILCTLLSWSCINIGDPNLPEPLSDEQISINLSENRKTDPELLIGEWDCEMFAYTVDGNKISNVKNISNLTQLSSWYKIRIVDGDPTLYFIDAPPSLFGPVAFGASSHFYSISGNLISFSRKLGYSFGINLPVSDEVLDVRFALGNTYSFAINGNELIIHFTGVENKNLLILKKR